MSRHPVVWECGCGSAVMAVAAPGQCRRCGEATWRRARPRRGGKYGVAPPEERTVGDIVFDSKGEMKRYLELKALEAGGVIADLDCQREFVLVPGVRWNGRTLRSIRFRVDFVYRTVGAIESVVAEDFKGMRTQAYVIKRQLFLHQHPDIEFRESERGRG